MVYFAIDTFLPRVDTLVDDKIEQIAYKIIYIKQTKITLTTLLICMTY